jgi:hypothetical protein
MKHEQFMKVLAKVISEYENKFTEDVIFCDLSFLDSENIDKITKYTYTTSKGFVVKEED